MGQGHPECPERLEAIAEALEATGLIERLQVHQARAARPDELALAHDAHYLDRLFDQLSDLTEAVQLDPDTAANAHTLTAALHAAGAALQATELVLAGEVQNAFCAVRPPGHHAMRAKAMGFCFFSNVAVAVRAALRRHGLKRVAVIDFDVHHGNGTEAMFSNDPRVLMCSFFQHPLFPNTGVDNPAPNMVNVPVAAYSSGAAIREIITSQWMPRLEAHQPELVMISAGFDAHREDDMGQLGLVETDYAWMTRQLVDLADRHAKGRVVSTLEGGYSLSALARSVVAHLRVLGKL
jgi:acetoin utilization deacetylase AcuC-like enzyme